MTFGELMADFSRRLNETEGLKPDESGTVALEVDGLTLSILGLEEVGQVVLSGVVGEMPPADRMERLYRSLLMANHNFAGTDGAAFSVNPETNEVALCRALPLALLDGEKFYADVEKFVNTLETWHKIVADFRGADLDEKGAEAAPAEGDSPLGGGLGGFMQV